MCGGTDPPELHSAIYEGLSPRVRGNRLLPTGASEGQRSIPACAGEPQQHLNQNDTGRVYPRVCGGTPCLSPHSSKTNGLSPRVRGNHVSLHGQLLSVGSIPACAGEPVGAPLDYSGAPVYPRVCGGTGARSIRLFAPAGLSPRVRGNPSSCHRAMMITRSIPACAGEPLYSISSENESEVYPRVCGGTSMTAQTSTRGAGLSPRVRGNLVQEVGGEVAERSIPACAGEPPTIYPTQSQSQVYPRVCGGTVSICGHRCGRKGLSPRVRGNPALAPSVSVRRWSIPACAGEPAAGNWSVTTPQVYPRVCGGTPSRLNGNRPETGLSPRVRGNHFCAALVFLVIGSIPACAGEPLLCGARFLGHRVYPRVCGGTTISIRKHSTSQGLSPRVRGNPCILLSASSCIRSIPACAGEPC